MQKMLLTLNLLAYCAFIQGAQQEADGVPTPSDRFSNFSLSSSHETGESRGITRPVPNGELAQSRSELVLEIDRLFRRIDIQSFCPQPTIRRGNRLETANYADDTDSSSTEPEVPNPNPRTRMQRTPRDQTTPHRTLQIPLAAFTLYVENEQWHAAQLAKLSLERLEDARTHQAEIVGLHKEHYERLSDLSLEQSARITTLIAKYQQLKKESEQAQTGWSRTIKNYAWWTSGAVSGALAGTATLTTLLLGYSWYKGFVLLDWTKIPPLFQVKK